MADDHHRAGPVLEHVLQDPQCVEVEVVRGLVEQDDVGLRPQGEHELEPATLTARQQPDRCPLGVGVEPEPLEEAGVLPVRAAGRPGDGLLDGHRGIQLDPLLGEHAERDRRADGDGPLGGGQVTGDHPQQGRLAGAVGTDDAEPLPGVEREVDTAEQPRPVAEAVAHPFEVDHVVAEAGGAESEIELAAAGRGFGPAFDDRRRRLDAGLRLARPRRRAPPEPRQLRTGEVATNRFLPRGLGLPVGLGFEVGGITALVHVAPAPIELDDPGRDPVEDVTVVGHQQEAAAVRGQAGLQPGDGVDVEVVGRLVQDEQDVVARLTRRADFDQGAGQRHPLRLAARERGRGRVEATAEVETSRMAAASHPVPVTSPMVEPGSGASWSSITTRLPRPRRTTPASGSLRPASWRSSVDLPQPLRPTTAMRSPDATVTETSANRGRPGRLAARPAASRRITPAGEAPGRVRLRAPASERPATACVTGERNDPHGWLGAGGASGTCTKRSST